MKVLVLFAHPAQQHSSVNAAMAEIAQNTDGISFVDLYAEYPRLDLDVEKEQQRLLAHDVIIFQFPLMWYSTPPILKEWLDIVLEYGFAYGAGGDSLAGKLWLTATTAGAAQSSYGPEGHNQFELRALLSPLEATANLCKMTYLAPYILFEALAASNARQIQDHVAGYQVLLEALRDDHFDKNGAGTLTLMGADTLPIAKKSTSKTQKAPA